MDLYSLFEAPNLGRLFGKNTKGLTTGQYTSRAQMISRRYTDRENYAQISQALRTFAERVAKYHELIGKADTEKQQQAAFAPVEKSLRSLADLKVASSDVRFLSSPQTEALYKQIRDARKQGPSQDKQAAAVRAGLKSQTSAAQAELDDIAQQPTSQEPSLTDVDTDTPLVNVDKDGNYSLEYFWQKSPRYKDPFNPAYLKSQNYDIMAPLARIAVDHYAEEIIDWRTRLPTYAHPLIKDALKLTVEHWRDEYAQWLEEDPSLKKHLGIEVVDGHEYYVPYTIKLLQFFGFYLERAIKDLAQREYPDLNLDESSANLDNQINETVRTVDDLVKTVAGYLYAKPETQHLFTKYGDEYVWQAVEHVVGKDADPDDPLQDIKAYALEVQDYLNRKMDEAATVQSTGKGHHLVNADGEVVQSFPSTTQGRKDAQQALMKNYIGLNIMKKKQDGLNEAFEDALAKLALNESVTINTTSSSEGDDTVTVTATAEDAHELVAILKAAGLPHKADEVQAQIVASPCSMEAVEEEFANAPHDDVMNGDMDDMNTQAGGLNRAKVQQKYANPLGDNPLAESDDLLHGLWDLYKEAK